MTRIVDHHVDNEYYPAEQLVDKEVRFIGSACSLLALRFKQDFGLMDSSLFDTSVHPNFAYFLAPPILLDSANFAPSLKGNKWSEEDVEVL